MPPQAAGNLREVQAHTRARVCTKLQASTGAQARSNVRACTRLQARLRLGACTLQVLGKRSSAVRGHPLTGTLLKKGVSYTRR